VYTCSLVAVGHELLDGRISDTNSDFIADALASLGIKVGLRIIVDDDLEDLRSTLNWAAVRSDLIIVTGGLGPTHDDITREAAAEAFQLPLHRDPEIEEAVRGLFRHMDREMPPSNLKQADLMEGAAPITARLGTAPGQILEREGKIIVLLPGVPREMKDMMANDVVPMLKEKLSIERTRKTLSFTVAARPESEVAETVSPALAQFNDVSVSYRAQPGEIEVRLEEWEKEGGNLARAAEVLKEVLGPWLVAEGDETLEGNLGGELRSRSLTLAVAESCTGGMVGERITRIPGSSDYFLGGVVAYSYAVKERLLQVEKGLLEEKGAVCEEVAEAMARGVKQLFSSDIGLAVTGVAGPGTGNEKEPAGSVAFGLASSQESLAWKFMLPGNRDMVRRVATTVLLAITHFYLQGAKEAIPHG